MNATSILPCFRIVSPFPINNKIQEAIQSDYQLNLLYADIQNMSIELAKNKYNNQKNNKINLRKNIAKGLDYVVRKRISIINSETLCQYYIWLNEIVRVHVKGTYVKIYKLEGKKYFDIDNITLRNIQNAIDQYLDILLEEGLYDPETFDNDIWLINMDILIRGEPNFIIWPDDYQYEWDDCDCEDDF